MEIKIEGDPDTGNTFIKINILHVEHFYPATSVPTNNNGTRARKSDMSTETEDITSLLNEILTYVNRYFEQP